MGNEINYQNYTVIDFILAAAAADEDFFQWVRQPNKRLDNRWNEWLEQHPYKREEVEEARYWVLLFRTLGEYPSPFQLEKEAFWDRIMDESRKRGWQSEDSSERSA